MSWSCVFPPLDFISTLCFSFSLLSIPVSQAFSLSPPSAWVIATQQHKLSKNEYHIWTQEIISHLIHLLFTIFHTPSSPLPMSGSGKPGDAGKAQKMWVMYISTESCTWAVPNSAIIMFHLILPGPVFSNQCWGKHAHLHYDRPHIQIQKVAHPMQILSLIQNPGSISHSPCCAYVVLKLSPLYMAVFGHLWLNGTVYWKTDFIFWIVGSICIGWVILKNILELVMMTSGYCIDMRVHVNLGCDEVHGGNNNHGMKQWCSLPQQTVTWWRSASKCDPLLWTPPLRG